MSDYEMNQDTRITSSVAFDNFIWREGTLEVYPSAEIMMGGQFFFSPTESNDPIGKIHRAIRSRIALQSGRGKTLEAFHIYNEFNPQKSYFFPCLIIHSDEPSETSSAFFGGEYLEGLPILIEVAFKRDKSKITSDGTLSGKGLAEYYLYETRNMIDEINFDSNFVNVGAVSYEDVIHEPVEQSQTLYGFELRMLVEFKDGVS